ncbi:MAG: LrgB family protein, partial [Atopostipes suicloacalis]|nr:LrgB family protein [Atopostipes suicloacalis]
IISGVLLHTIIIIALSLILKLDAEMIGTLIPKSITTAIAISVSDSLGGIVSLTVALVIVTGIIGTVLAPLVFKLAKIEHPIAQGVALGSSAHALGTTKAIELGEIQGAMSSLSLVVTGIVTVIFIPLVEFLLNLFF